MTIKTQLIIVFLLGTFCITPLLTLLMGTTGLILSLVCMIHIIWKYWGTE